jgi:hypothetical protein
VPPEAKDFQNTALARRAAMQTRMQASDATFTEILGEGKALELAVEELPFIFWHPHAAYDNGAAMHDVQDWITTSGSQILLIYGQNDPWTAGAVSLGDATDSFKLISPSGNHGSSIGTLASRPSAPPSSSSAGTDSATWSSAPD